MHSRRFSPADLLLITVAVIWGVNVVVVKAALTELAPLPFNSLRFALSALLCWAVLRASGGKMLPERADFLRIAVLGLLGHGLYQALFIQGTNLTSAGNTALLLATIPVWVAALAALTRAEATGPFVWLGIGLSVTGIVLVTLGGSTWQGDAMLVFGTFFYACYTLKSKGLLQKYSALQFTTWTLTAGAAALALFSLGPLAAQDWGAVGLAGWGGLFYSAVLAIVAGNYIWTNGVQKLGAARTAIYNNLTPVTAMLMGSLFLDEAISLPQVAGAVLIIGGLYLPRSRGKATQASVEVSN
jgi:drug/metabolite transporter (DMT)-like permease